MAGQRLGSGDRVRVPKTAELVARHLRRQIVLGELEEGDALPPETVLIEMFGVSRPTLREAFRVLESEALISVRRGSHGGARVHVPCDDIAARYASLVLEHRGATVADVYEARIIIEPPCVVRLAARRTAADVKRLRAAVEDAEAIPDPVEAVHQQNNFHSLVVDLSGNQTLRVIHQMLAHIIDVAMVNHVARRQRSGDDRTAHHTGLRAHRRVVELIDARDGEGAERVWRRHLAESTKYLLDGQSASAVVELLE